MKQMTVDRQQGHAAAEFRHHMRRPDLVEERAWMFLQDSYPKSGYTNTGDYCPLLQLFRPSSPARRQFGIVAGGWEVMKSK